MIARPVVLDAGPALTFAAADRHALLVDVVAERASRLLTPETVIIEVENKARRDRRFAQCPKRIGRRASAGCLPRDPSGSVEAALEHLAGKPGGAQVILFEAGGAARRVLEQSRYPIQLQAVGRQYVGGLRRPEGHRRTSP